jgi:hypothetical protein
MQRFLMAVLALPFLLVASDAALAQKRIGVREFAVTGTTAGLPDGYGRRLAESVVSEMSLLLRTEQKFSTCDATAEITNAADPADAPPAPTHLVEGRIEIAGPEASYEIAARSASGPSGSTEGRYAVSDQSGFPASQIAFALLEKICNDMDSALRASRINLDFNDLHVDQVVCNIHQPFKLSGTGATRNIHFTLVPSERGKGEWTVAGTAAGGVWSGAGTYVLDIENGYGSIVLSGRWGVTAPMGSFFTSDDMPGLVAPDDDACKQMY